MIHSNIKDFFKESNENKESILKEALLNSYDFHTDILSNTSFHRERSDISFNEALEIALKIDTHWTIIFRDSIIKNEKAYWEFGFSTLGNIPEIFIWIKVRTEIAEEIFKKYNLIQNIY